MYVFVNVESLHMGYCFCNMHSSNLARYEY